MIKQLSFTPCPDMLMPWASALSYFKENPVTEFQPGLNIVFGGNGSGKSSLLQMLALSLAAKQGGTSVVTSSWVSDVLGWSGARSRLPCEVVHDGQPLLFMDARASEGLIAGSFDDDFFEMGLANTLTKGSTGELVISRLSRLLDVLTARATPEKTDQAACVRGAEKRKGSTVKDLSRKEGRKSLVPSGFPEKIEWRIPVKSVSASVQDRIDTVTALLSAKCEKGPRTLIFDEPESGFSLPWQAALWQNIFAKVDPTRFQVIVSTHSPFALNIPGAKYIELTPDYLRQSENAVRALLSRMPRSGPQNSAAVD